MKNLLFDEKIGGTIHIAIGMSYPVPLDKGGGLNQSPLHWDIVCELRKLGNNPADGLKSMESLCRKTAPGCSDFYFNFFIFQHHNAYKLKYIRNN